MIRDKFNWSNFTTVIGPLCFLTEKYRLKTFLYSVFVYLRPSFQLLNQLTDFFTKFCYDHYVIEGYPQPGSIHCHTSVIQHGVLVSWWGGRDISIFSKTALTWVKYRDKLPKRKCIGGILKKITLSALGSQTQYISFLESGFTDQTARIVFQYEATNNCLVALQFPR
jgi:hypothetical protein